MSKSKTRRPIVKILGIQRSGTNYLTKLLDANFPKNKLLVMGGGQLGAKHMVFTLSEIKQWLADHPEYAWVDTCFDDVRIVVTTRDPYSWPIGHLRHIAKNPALRKSCTWKPGSPTDHAWLIKNSWNTRCKAWRNLCEAYPDKVMHVQFEKIVTDIKQVVRSIAAKFGLPDVPTDLVDFEWEVCSNGQLSSDAYDRQEYYAKRQYLQELKPGIIKAISKATDWETAKYFGYTKE